MGGRKKRKKETEKEKNEKKEDVGRAQRKSVEPKKEPFCQRGGAKGGGGDSGGKRSIKK